MPSAPAIPCIYIKGVFAPLKRATNLAAAHYGDGEVVMLAPVEERSRATHNHFFALVHEAWLNLPAHLAERFPNEEALRKHALIKAGYCTITDYPCGSRAEAERWAANLRREIDDYCIIVIEGSVVRVFKAQSQSMKAMGKARFQESKDAALGVLATMIGVESETLKRQPEAA